MGKISDIGCSPAWHTVFELLRAEALASALEPLTAHGRTGDGWADLRISQQAQTA